MTLQLQSSQTHYASLCGLIKKSVTYVNYSFFGKLTVPYICTVFSLQRTRLQLVQIFYLFACYTRQRVDMRVSDILNSVCIVLK